MSVEITDEQRKKIEDELKQWMRDPNHIVITPMPNVTVLGSPEFCPASGRYPKLKESVNGQPE